MSVKETKLKVMLVGFMGEDLCAKGARICTEALTPEAIMGTNGNGKKTDEEILRGAINMGHLAVTEMSYFVFIVSGISRTASHQLVRKRIASYLQQSMRYTSQNGEYKVRVPTSLKNKVAQVSVPLIKLPQFLQDAVKEHPEHNSELPDTHVAIPMSLTDLAETSHQYYEGMTEQKVPNEDARFGLLEASNTQIMVAMNGHSLLDFFSDRTCTCAQWEIREMAIEMMKLAKNAAPIIMSNAGPKCHRTHYCHEMKSKWNVCKHRPHVSSINDKDELVSALRDQNRRLQAQLDIVDSALT